MLKIVEAEDLLLDVLPKDLHAIIADIVLRQQNGERIITKVKYTKHASYLNIYEYDKTSWRYILTKQIEIDI